MRKIWFVLLGCISVIRSQGQITFERKDYFAGLYPCCPFSTTILETPDHGYLSAGRIAEGLVTFFYWEKIDSSGHHLWSYDFGLMADATINSASLTSDSGFILCGNGLGLGSGFPMGIIKTNLNGSIEWSKIISVQGGTDLYGNSVLQTKDGGYIIAGTVFGIGGFDGKLMKLDSSGNVLWSKVYYGSQFEAIVFNDIVQTFDSGFIVVGQSHLPCLNDIVTILGINSNGDTLWTKQYASGYMSLQPTSIARTYDSCYVISGYDNSAAYPGSFLFKINGSGDTLWKKEFGIGDSLIINNVEQVNDSGLILSATKDYYIGLIIKTNSSGDILWTRELISDCWSKYVIPTTDFGFAIAGGSGFSVVKTDSLGNTVCTSNMSAVTTSMSALNQVYSTINISTDTLIFPFTSFATYQADILDGMLCSSLQLNDVNLGNSKIELFPNPADKILKIKSESEILRFEIYSSLGIIVQKTILNTKDFEIDISELTPSLYFIKLYSKEGVSTSKFLKNENLN